MRAHLVWKAGEANKVVTEKIFAIFGKYVERSKYLLLQGIDFKVDDYGDEYYITLKGDGRVRGRDVLESCLARDIWLVMRQHPEASIRWTDDCHIERGAWFACTEGNIYYNTRRESQFVYRDCTDVFGKRGHTGHHSINGIKDIQVFGEGCAVRKVMKRINYEARLKEGFIDFRPESPIMELAGLNVLILVQANNGQFQMINDNLYLTENELCYSESAPGTPPLYSFIYNHHVFN